MTFGRCPQPLVVAIKYAAVAMKALNVKFIQKVENAGHSWSSMFCSSASTIKC